MTIRADRAPSIPIDLSVSVDTSAGRATPEPADRRFRAVLRDGAGLLLDGVESATGVLPGGGAVIAAVHAAREGVEDAMDGGDGGSAASSLEEALGRQADTQMQYIELQQRMQDENRRFTTLSNVLKARHETAKTAIGNIR